TTAGCTSSHATQATAPSWCRRPTTQRSAKRSPTCWRRPARSCGGLFMTRTTPPRPVDIAALFPLLQRHSSVATRLHPRRGEPTIMDSSVGGPLLWPAEEAWPYCDAPHDYLHKLYSPAALRRGREIWDTAWRRTATGERVTLTDQEHAELPYLKP